MNPIWIVLIFAGVTIIPLAFFLGARGFMILIGILLLLVLFGFGMYFAYWYLFVRRE